MASTLKAPREIIKEASRADNSAEAPRVGEISAMRVASIADHRRLARKIISAYPTSGSRAYLRVRFTVLNVNIFNLLRLCTSGYKRILDVGCGYGLLGCYLGMHNPELTYLGCDLDARRTQIANRAAKNLGLAHVRFEARGARDLSVEQEFDAIVLMDCLHHLDDDTKRYLLKTCHRLLRPGGALIVKEVGRDPWWKMACAWLQDLLVYGPDVWYWSEAKFMRELTTMGFDTQIYGILDRFPCPHILCRCSKL